MHLLVGRDFVPTLSFTLGHFFFSVLLSIRLFLVQPFDLKSYGDCYSCWIFRSTLLLPFAHSFGDAAFAFASCAFFRRRCFRFRLLRILSLGDAAFVFASSAFFRRATLLSFSPLAPSFGLFHSLVFMTGRACLDGRPCWGVPQLNALAFFR